MEKQAVEENPFRQFEELAKKLIAVPKPEVDEKERQYKKKRKRAKAKKKLETS
jgi:hypothetical protein